MSSFIFDLLPEEIQTKEGNKKIDLSSAPFFGVYFSAHWCPPCRGFTPVLSNFYEIANKNQKQIEIIFCSSDRDPSSFNEYYETMPWTAIPYNNQDPKQNLKEAYNINGIPTLLIFSKNGKLIDTEGRKTIQNRYPKDGYTENTVKTIIDIWTQKSQ